MKRPICAIGVGMMIAAAVTGPVRGEERPNLERVLKSPTIQQPSAHAARTPSLTYSIASAPVATDPDELPLGQALMTAIVAWLSHNFDLPAGYDLPKIERATPAKITALRYRGPAADFELTADHAGDRSGSSGTHEVVAVYRDATRTIYLPQDWTGNSPAEMSVLVHEMTHHLQNVARRRFNCPEEREKVAYDAQAKWLGMFGRTLREDFELDPLTLMLATQCIP